MSKRWLRHFVAATVFIAVPLISVGPVQASPPTVSTRTSAIPESAVLRKFRDSGPPVMQQASQFEANSAPGKSAPITALRSLPLAAPNNPRLFGEVFGFAFASSLGDNTIGYPSWNFALLSTVAYFGVHVSWTGDFSNDSSLTTWNNPYGPVPGFINTAHSYGTKVVLTLIMFDSTPGTPNMCSALQRSALTIQNTVNQVLAKGIDGVNVDYESNNSDCVDGNGTHQSSQSLFTYFVRNLRAALPTGSYLSVDTYSGAAGYRDGSGNFLGFFDIGALAGSVDSFFVMAYDMEYANWDSPPLSCLSFCIGPTAPLSTYLFNDERASSEYRAVVPGSKVIMGIPYYGRKECVDGYNSSNAPPNVGGNQVAADGYLDASTEEGYYANTLYYRHREARDVAGATRWDTFYSSTYACTREMYWDDAPALGNKYDLVIHDRLRGIGIFALNYGGGAPELWSLINLKFGQCSQAAIAANLSSPQIPGTSITFTGSALCAGTAQYEFQVQPPGGSWTYLQSYGTQDNVTWNTTGKPLGTYQFEVDARNLGSSVSYDTYADMSMRLARCVTPVITPDHPSPQLPGTAITLTASVTCNGTPEYQFSMQPPGGAGSVVQPYSSAAALHWNTTQLAYGNYSFSVSVRVVGTTVAAESTQTMTYSLTSCNTTALVTDKTSPQPTGTHVTLTGSATCVGAPQYRFMVQPPGGTWSVVQDFGSNATFTWNGAGPGGTYGLELDARGAAAATSTMDSAQLSFALAACSAVTLTSSLNTPQVPGASVGLTGSATCPGAPQYRFAVQKPGAAYTVVQDYGSATTYAWNTTGLALGDYGLKVDVRNVGATTTSEASASAVFTLSNAACTVPTFSTDKASPQGAGTVITFTANTTTCPSPLFRFLVQTPAPDLAWTVMQDYSTSKTWKWQPSGPAGNYRIEIDARDSTRPVPWDQYAVDPFTINACTGAALSPSVPSPQAAGTQIVLTGSAAPSTFCPNPVYQFWVLAPGSTWTIAQPFSATATFNWNTAGKPGVYHLSVWVRDASSAGAINSTLGNYDTFAGAVYTLNTQPCKSVTASAAPTSPAPAGTAVTITPVASGCPNPQYQYWILAPGSGAWTVAQPYSTSATFNWNTAGKAIGAYSFSVWVRDTSSAGTSCNSLGCVDAFVGTTYTLKTTACTSATASAAPGSSSPAGTAVTVSGVASGCTNPLYQFWILAPGSSTWTLAQAYSSNATFNWSTTGPLTAGVYHFSVWVRDTSSAGATGTSMGTFDAFVGVAYTLTSTPCTSVTASATPPSPSVHGAAISFTGVATGCASPLYEFWILTPGSSTWTVVQAYSASPTLNWSTTGLPAGTYRVSVWVRDASSSGAVSTSLGTFDTFVGIPYTLT